MKSIAYLKNYLLRLIILLFLYTLSRIAFLLNNNITNASILEFVEGIRFDISAIVYINIPIFILLLIPTNYRTNKFYQNFTNLLFYCINIFFLILNNIDIEYFRYTQKRSTSDLFHLFQLGSDIIRIGPQYIKDYWMITLFTIIQSWIIIKIKYIPKIKTTKTFKSIGSSVVILFLSISFFIISARGGLQLKPIKIINAGELTASDNSSLILNTPFCILQSINTNTLKEFEYFKDDNIRSFYSISHKKSSDPINKKNIVILILESFSKEFVGVYNTKSHTPFLDSLSYHSLIFTNAYANGLKSIEALPAITASIPSLMDNPYITSKYAQNNFESLASLLNKKGYKSSFFHGGFKGTMGFYSFCKKAQFSKYFGMDEYNNNSDYDGSWGIYDNPFMQYFGEELNNTKEPFISVLFTLTSHPPYTLPENEKKKYKKIGILETVSYTDKALSNFFKKVKNKNWFKNTIFIITADHTSPESFSNEYSDIMGRYSIPMIIFKGDSSFVGTNTNIVQQIDIMPTVLEMINYDENYFSFGKSMLKNQNWTINYLEGKYRLLTKKGIVINQNEEYENYMELNLKNKVDNIEGENLMKAIKQTYSSKIIKNELKYED